MTGVIPMERREQAIAIGSGQPAAGGTRCFNGRRQPRFLLSNSELQRKTNMNAQRYSVRPSETTNGDGFRCRGKKRSLCRGILDYLSRMSSIAIGGFATQTRKDIQMSKAEEQGHRRPVVHRSERPGLPACECADFAPHELCGTRFFLMPRPFTCCHTNQNPTPRIRPVLQRPE